MWCLCLQLIKIYFAILLVTFFFLIIHVNNGSQPDAIRFISNKLFFYWIWQSSKMYVNHYNIHLKHIFILKVNKFTYNAPQGFVFECYIVPFDYLYSFIWLVIEYIYNFVSKFGFKLCYETIIDNSLTVDRFIRAM